MLTVTADSPPKRYRAVDIQLTVSGADDRTYTISPALIAAVARRTTDETIDSTLIGEESMVWRLR